MAHIRVSYRFSDGDELEAECYVENDYPDAMSTARAEAMRGFREAFAYTVQTLTREDNP